MITAQYKNVTASLEITVLENITPEPTTEVPTPEPTMEIPTPEPPIVEEAAPTPTIPQLFSINFIYIGSTFNDPKPILNNVEKPKRFTI